MSEDEIILTHILKCSRSELLSKKIKLNVSQQRQFKRYQARRRKGEPLQYILGSWDFFGLEFKIDPRVLVPRPETEVLVELAVKRFKGTHILDLGTGSGNIAVTLAKLLPKAQVVAVDISPKALTLAKQNAKQHGVAQRINFVHADMGKYCAKPGQPFDLVISNPPYVPTGDMTGLPIDVKQEPALALDGGPDGLNFYKIIIKYSPCLLSEGGWLMMEFGDGQAKALKKLAKGQAAISDIEIHKDLAGKERIFIGKIRH